MNDELEPCPSCEIDEEIVAEIGPLDAYRPELISLFGLWFVSCQNCGFTGAFDGATKADAIRHWNQLRRGK